MRRPATRLLAACFILFTAAAVLLTIGHLIGRDQINRAAFDQARGEAIDAAAQISSAFEGVIATAERVVADLESGRLAYADIEAYLFDAVQAQPDVYGIAITFQPFAYDPALRLFQTYVFQDGEGGYDSLVGATYDYTQTPDAANGIFTDWYYNTITSGAQWHAPFFATGAQRVLIEYGAPFTAPGAPPGSPPAGIVTVDYTLGGVNALMRELQLGSTGYGFVIDQDGRFIAHPARELLIRSTIFDDSTSGLAEAARRALNGENAFLDTHDPETDTMHWYFLEPIGTSGFAIGVVLDTAEFMPSARQTAREHIAIALASGGALFFGLFTVFHIDRYRFTGFWTTSLTFTFICIALIVITWALTARLDDFTGTGISSLSQLERYLQTSLPDANADLTTTPVGILVQSIHFNGATLASVNGYLWQRIPAGSDIEAGLNMPQMTGPEMILDEVSRRTINGHEQVIWYFGADLRQRFDPTRFPFDQRTVEIRLTSAYPGMNILLTPDLEGYERLNPRLLPGIDSQMDINNWMLHTSRFSYSEGRITQSVGLDAREQVIGVPELRFTVQIQRVALGPFIAYLLPALIAALMTFGYLLSAHEPGRKEEVANALTYAAAVFFVVAVIHTGLRDQIAAVGITYIEHIYLLLYVALIAVAANMFLLAWHPEWWIIRYRENLVMKVMYWPVFVGVLLVTTLFTFL